MASPRDVYWKRQAVPRPASRARQLAGDAVAGILVGVVIVLGIALLW
jgi:hypothetical protein